MAGEGSRASRPVTRRDVLRAAGLATGLAPVWAVAACDIRLQDDAPSIPLLQRKSIPDEGVLVDAARRTAMLALLAGRVTKPSAAITRLAAQHRTQAEALRGRLAAGGVPQSVIDPPPDPTGTPTPTAAVSAPPPATSADLGSAEAAAATALLPSLPAVTAANRAILVSVTSACAAAADQLGVGVPWPADPLPAQGATRLLEDTRAAEYAFQVVAAQTSGGRRAAALATRTQLGSRETELTAMAGATAPAAPLGFALRFPVTSPEAAERLATQVLTTLVAGGLAPLATLPEGSSAVLTLARLLSGAQALGRPWGVLPTPFPGMAYP